MGAAFSACCSQSHGVKEDVYIGKHKAAEASTSETDANDVLNDDDDKAMMDKMKGTKRRQGVAAESVAPINVRDYKKPVYPKDEAAKKRIKEVLKSDQKMQVLFGHLDEAGIMDIVNAFKDCTSKKGDALIRQGDEGDCLYIINSGEVDIFVARPGPDGSVDPKNIGQKVVSLGQDKLFGELALMYAAPRAATAIVGSGSCKLWQLDREPFKMLLAQKSQAQHELYEGWLSSVDILKPLNRYELSKLSELLQSELFDNGETIVKQGEPGEKFYILEDGTCNAYLEGGDGEKLVKEYNTQGQYFGEIALLNNEPRKATIRASGSGASVLSCSKEDFTEVLGPIEDILRKQIDRYPQLSHFLKK